MKPKAIFQILILSLFLFFCLIPSVSAAPEQPLLQITAVTFSPATVSPGKEFKMAVTLTNHGEYDAYNVNLDIISVAGAPDLGVFSMVGSGSHFYLEEILSGESATIEVPMVSSPNAEAKNYNLNLQIYCESSGGSEYNFNETVGVLVNESDSISIIAPDRYTLKEDDNGVASIEFEVANYGSNPVRGIEVGIAGDGLEFSTDYQYFGTFEKDDNDNFSTEVKTTQKGEFPGKITLKYMDSFNNQHTLEKAITIVSADDPTDTANTSDENVFQKFLRVIFGIGA